MNVIIMGNFLYPEGMAGTKRVQHFIDYLTEHAVSVKLLLLRQSQAEIAKNECEGIYKGNYYKTIGNDLRFGLGIILKLPLFFWQGLTFLIKWRRKNIKNVLYCYQGPTIENCWLIILARLLGYKIVFDIVEDYSHLDESLHLLAKLKLKTALFLDKNIAILADGLVLISHYLMKKYQKLIGKNVPIKLIPISAKIRNDDKKIGFAYPVKIVYSGSFAKKDGVEQLIEAFMNVCQLRKDMVLLLTGKGHKENIERIKQKIETIDSIKYLGYLDDNDFYDFLHEADILCMTRMGSKFADAGFPFKLGEYLATGNPVIASNITDVGFYLQNMKDVILVEPDNVKAIQRAIEYLTENPESALKIGNAGKQKCQAFFDPQKNARTLMDLFDSI